MNCANCDARRPADAHGAGWRGPYCRRCLDRWRYHGCPAGGPPPSRQQVSGPRAGRLEDYTELRSWGVSPAEAAERLGVTVRTVQRYEAALRTAEDAARTRSSAPRAARLEDYAELRSWGEPMENAAERVGVSFRTAQRYEAVLAEVAA